MPAKNSQKDYLENGYYHLYNRGVEKRKIFQDEQDCSVFLSYLKEYLTPKDTEKLNFQLENPSLSSREKDKILRLLKMNNFYNEIDLLCYCLMPNHFHFELHQHSLDSIDNFMNSLGTRYTLYFNKKYKRVGSLYQGVYKAVLVKSENQLLHLSRYIHQQSLISKPASKGEALRSWKQKQPSSLPEYLGLRNTSWIKTNEILKYLDKIKANSLLSYDAFVKGNDDFEAIKEIIIEN